MAAATSAATRANLVAAPSPKRRVQQCFQQCSLCSVCVCDHLQSLYTCTRAQAATITAPRKSVKGLTVFAYNYTGVHGNVGDTVVITFKADDSEDIKECSMDYGELNIPNINNMQCWQSGAAGKELLAEVQRCVQTDTVTWKRDHKPTGNLVAWSTKWKGACRLLYDFDGYPAGNTTLENYLVSYLVCVCVCVCV